MNAAPAFRVIEGGRPRIPQDDSYHMPQALIDDIQRFDREESSKLDWHIGKDKLGMILGLISVRPGCTTREISESLNYTQRIVSLALHKAWSEHLIFRSVDWSRSTGTYHWAPVGYSVPGVIWI